MQQRGTVLIHIENRSPRIEGITGDRHGLVQLPIIPPGFLRLHLRGVAVQVPPEHDVQLEQPAAAAPPQAVQPGAIERHGHLRQIGRAHV